MGNLKNSPVAGRLLTKRLFDIVVTSIFIVVLIIPIILAALAVKLTSKGPVIHWSKRIGQNSAVLKMPKFRSFYINAPGISGNSATDDKKVLTPIGKFIRKSSLDELPQFFSILKGDMSLIGPRPLISSRRFDSLTCTLRAKQGIDKLLPGLTGWAQINGRGNITPIEKVALDVEYAKKQSLWFDIKILYLTIIRVITRDNVSD